jgi:hypothetical protein
LCKASLSRSASGVSPAVGSMRTCFLRPHIEANYQSTGARQGRWRTGIALGQAFRAGL